MAIPRLTPGTAPSTQRFPTTPQDMLAFIAAFMAITGIEANASFVIGSDTPAAADQDKPWLRLDATGDPVGWYVWNGAAWVTMRTTMPSGTTAERPVTPNDYELFFDTDIDCALIFERGQWRTVDGSPGDIKFVTAATLGDAITRSPGWSEYTDMRGRSPMGAGTGLGLTARTTLTDYGAEGHQMTLLNLIQHNHSFSYYKQDTSGGTQEFAMQDSNDEAGHGTGNWPTDNAGQAAPDAIPVVHPVRALYCLVKD